MEETRYGDGIQKKKKKGIQPVGSYKKWVWVGVGQGLDESISQGGGVPLSDMEDKVLTP